MIEDESKRQICMSDKRGALREVPHTDRIPERRIDGTARREHSEILMQMIFPEFSGSDCKRACVSLGMASKLLETGPSPSLRDQLQTFIGVRDFPCVGAKRSQERRVGKEGFRTCRSWWAPY